MSDPKPRDYAAEADEIILGEGPHAKLIPERAHLLAMAQRAIDRHNEKVTALNEKVTALRNEQFAKTVLAAVMLNNHVGQMQLTHELILGVNGKLAIVPRPDGSVIVTYTAQPIATEPRRVM